jgi:hypothetical protein
VTIRPGQKWWFDESHFKYPNRQIRRSGHVPASDIFELPVALRPIAIDMLATGARLEEAALTWLSEPRETSKARQCSSYGKRFCNQALPLPTLSCESGNSLIGDRGLKFPVLGVHPRERTG